MALSKPVEDSVNEAISAIRNALSYASRNEHPAIINTLAKCLADLDAVDMMDSLFSKAEDIYRAKKMNGEDIFG
jgi:hypothetical protein